MVKGEKDSFENTFLGPKVCRRTNVFMLSFGCSPRMVQLEALVAITSLAVHAALCGLLRWRLADVTHDGHSSAGSLAVALNNALQGEVTEQHADAALAKVDIVLTARAVDGGDARGHGPFAPTRG